nr:uncharacterized protein LOC111748354 [Loxodonta africana]
MGPRALYACGGPAWWGRGLSVPVVSVLAWRGGATGCLCWWCLSWPGVVGPQALCACGGLVWWGQGLFVPVVRGPDLLASPSHMQSQDTDAAGRSDGSMGWAVQSARAQGLSRLQGQGSWLTVVQCTSCVTAGHDLSGASVSPSVPSVWVWVGAAQMRLLGAALRRQGLAPLGQKGRSRHAREHRPLSDTAPVAHVSLRGGGGGGGAQETRPFRPPCSPARPDWPAPCLPRSDWPAWPVRRKSGGRAGFIQPGAAAPALGVVTVPRVPAALGLGTDGWRPRPGRGFAPLSPQPRRPRWPVARCGGSAPPRAAGLRSPGRPRALPIGAPASQVGVTQAACTGHGSEPLAFRATPRAEGRGGAGPGRGACAVVRVTGALRAGVSRLFLRVTQPPAAVTESVGALDAPSVCGRRRPRPASASYKQEEVTSSRNPRTTSCPPSRRPSHGDAAPSCVAAMEAPAAGGHPASWHPGPRPRLYKVAKMPYTVQQQVPVKNLQQEVPASQQILVPPQAGCPTTATLQQP